jgi:hypothetical protein
MPIITRITGVSWVSSVVNSESPMADKNLSENQESTGRGASGEPESRPGWKSKWVESTAPTADDPISPEEMQGHNLLGNASLRGGAIAGVSDPVRDGHGAPGERPDDVKYDGPRLNPPELDEVPGDGGEETTE